MTSSSPDGLDRALTAYFHDQVPNPWPACRALEGNPTPVPAARRRNESVSGRAILALSVAALLGFGLLLSSGFPASHPAVPATDPGVLRGSTADGTNLIPPPKKVPMGDKEGPLN
ncbi:MAG TPA: hypothetical protein VGJ05_06760 [Fimbriiglobus sp.]|jgi:hypothetical protein